jgi:hypothetical protein
VAAAPIVPDHVDRFVEALQLVFEPIPVSQVGRGESVGQPRAESWWRQRHHVVAPESIDERLPNCRSLRIAVHQYDCHRLAG